MTGRRPSRASASLIAALGAAIVAVASAPIAAGQQRPPTVIDVLTIDGIIDPPIASALQDTVEVAAASGASAVLIDLDSPGVLSVDLSMVTPVLEAPLPVIVWVGPGAIAAGGAAYLAVAADVTIVAPTGRVGPAIPFALAEGEPGTADPAREGLSDYTSLRRTVLADHPDSPIVASELAVDSMDATTLIARGLADLTAEGRDLGLAALSRQPIEKDGAVYVLDIGAQNTALRGHELSLARRLLHAASSPGVAFALLVAGIAALLMLPVRAAFATLILGLVIPFLIFGIAALPARWWAVALIVVGLTLVAIDAGLIWLGATTAVGIACLVLGGLWMMSGAPRLRVPWTVVALAAALAGLVSLWGRRRQDLLIERLWEEEVASATDPFGSALV